jgi:hypothetical protein
MLSPHWLKMKGYSRLRSDLQNQSNCVLSIPLETKRRFYTSQKENTKQRGSRKWWRIKRNVAEFIFILYFFASQFMCPQADHTVRNSSSAYVSPHVQYVHISIQYILLNASSFCGYFCRVYVNLQVEKRHYNQHHDSVGLGTSYRWFVTGRSIITSLQLNKIVPKHHTKAM